MRITGTAGPLACLLLFAAIGSAAPLRAAVTDGAPTGSSYGAQVARLSLLKSGSVAIARGDAAQVAATLNVPLLPGDSFTSVDRNTLAEIQLDGFTDVRLSGDVRGRIIDNDVRARRIGLTSGLIELSLLRGEDAPSEIVTPSFTLRTHYAGNYRIFLQTDGTASIASRSGQADVITTRRVLTILAGTMVVVRGSPTDVSIESRPDLARDSFDEFNAGRDRTLVAALESDTYVPPSIAGYDDLAAYGRWTTLASYGQVWIPNGQSADWSPYRDGHWSYVGNDGWTWIGSEPWAWVPYHYGRWLYSSGYDWCWYPPPLGFSPELAPPLVGFFGTGANEPYVPWYPTRYYPPPPPPPQHRGPPAAMSPLKAYQNARFGGTPAIDTAPATPKQSIVPSIPTGIPHAMLPEAAPIVHAPTPSHPAHSISPHPPA